MHNMWCTMCWSTRKRRRSILLKDCNNILPFSLDNRLHLSRRASYLQKYDLDAFFQFGLYYIIKILLFYTQRSKLTCISKPVLQRIAAAFLLHSIGHYCKITSSVLLMLTQYAFLTSSLFLHLCVWYSEEWMSLQLDCSSCDARECRNRFFFLTGPPLAPPHRRQWRECQKSWVIILLIFLSFPALIKHT